MRRSTTALASIAAIVAAALLLASCGSDPEPRAGARPAAAPSSSTTTAPDRPTEPVDRLVPVGDGEPRLHLSCTGSGSETVLLLSGFGDAGESWSAVAPDLAARSRVCTPTRLGLGTSDAPPADQTFATQADALHHVLAAAGEPGPYVVVGHSFGGPEAVAFTAAHPDEVDGLLLLDASPVGWPAAACAVPDDGSEVAASFATVCASYAPDQNPERLDAAAAFAEVGAIDSLGDVPLAVLTRSEVAYPGLAPDAVAALAGTWREGQARWASLSTHSEVISVERTGHVIQVDQPAVVIAQVEALLG